MFWLMAVFFDATAKEAISQQTKALETTLGRNSYYTRQRDRQQGIAFVTVCICVYLYTSWFWLKAFRNQIQLARQQARIQTLVPFRKHLEWCMPYHCAPRWWFSVSLVTSTGWVLANVSAHLFRGWNISRFFPRLRGRKGVSRRTVECLPGWISRLASAVSIVPFRWSVTKRAIKA